MRNIVWLSIVVAVGFYLSTSSTGAQTALLVIDVQHCFLKNGSLEVKNGDDVIPVINDIRNEYDKYFSLVIFTQDWHCRDHVSFASEHPGAQVMSQTVLEYTKSGKLCSAPDCDVMYNVTQTLWPDHCVMNTSSAEFSSKLTRKPSDVVVKKGYNCDVDSYSGFFDNGGFSHTELDSKLKEKNISRVLITGLALDYCVYYTAMDADKLNYTTYVVEDASRPVAESTAIKALSDLNSSGVRIITSRDIGAVLGLTSPAARATLSFSALCVLLLWRFI